MSKELALDAKGCHLNLRLLFIPVKGKGQEMFLIIPADGDKYAALQLPKSTEPRPVGMVAQALQSTQYLDAYNKMVRAFPTKVIVANAAGMRALLSRPGEQRAYIVAEHAKPDGNLRVVPLEDAAATAETLTFRQPPLPGAIPLGVLLPQGQAASTLTCSS